MIATMQATCPKSDRKSLGELPHDAVSDPLMPLDWCLATAMGTARGLPQSGICEEFVSRQQRLHSVSTRLTRCSHTTARSPFLATPLRETFF